MSSLLLSCAFLNLQYVCNYSPLCFKADFSSVCCSAVVHQSEIVFGALSMVQTVSYL